MAKYKKLKDTLAYGQYKIFLIVSFWEKLKNLLIWEHPVKTKYALAALIIAFIVYNSLPWRVLFFLGVLARAKKGYKFYEKTRKHNKLILYEIICLAAKNHPEMKQNV
mmetsp:Transcript_16100/g.1444  ORF Transcript_16100/g.1444 Transcript_16100/m.1444 type:complete len:108 (-) Transcript_16100:140-463(-)